MVIVTCIILQYFPSYSPIIQIAVELVRATLVLSTAFAFARKPDDPVV